MHRVISVAKTTNYTGGVIVIRTNCQLMKQKLPSLLDATSVSCSYYIACRRVVIRLLSKPLSRQRFSYASFVWTVFAVVEVDIQRMLIACLY